MSHTQTMSYGLDLPMDLVPTVFTHTEFPLLFVTAFQSVSSDKDLPSLRKTGM